MRKKDLDKEIQLLPVIPEMIAESAFWEALEEGKYFKNQTPEQDYALQQEIVPTVVEMFEGIYKAPTEFAQNEFRRGCKKGTRATHMDPRMYLGMWMKHWATSQLMRKQRGAPLNWYKVFPHEG